MNEVEKLVERLERGMEMIWDKTVETQQFEKTGHPNLWLMRRELDKLCGHFVKLLHQYERAYDEERHYEIGGRIIVELRYPTLKETAND